MAETEKEFKPTNSPLIGSQAQPTVLDKTVKIDIDTTKSLADNIISAGLSSQLDISALENFTSMSNSRDQIYQLIDTMAADSSVSSIIRTYAEEVCEPADNGHIVWCESSDPNISKFVNYLLNVMNVDKNIFGWVYCLIKYGDVYLKLYRESDYQDPIFKTDSIDKTYRAKSSLHEGLENELDENVNLNIHKANDPYSYYVEMVNDPGSMFELTKYGKTYGYIEVPVEDNTVNFLQNYMVTNQNQPISNYKMRTNDVNIYQADDFVHACLEEGLSRFPEKVDIYLTESDYNTNTNSTSYTVRRGKSLLYDSYKIWREKALLEDSALLNRITRSSVVRNWQVEVGDMPKTQVSNTLRRVKELIEQKSAINTNNGMGEYTNPGPILNDIFTATHNGQGALTVNAVGGDFEVSKLADLDWWNNKFYSSYGIPKQYFGQCEDSAGFNGGTSLSILSSVFAKGVKRVQNSMLQAITDIINLICLSKGCRSYLNNFVLKMREPITQEEKDYRAALSDRISAISNMQSLFSDIETRSRKLTLLKDLLKTLSYGDEMITVIDKEIEAAEKAEKLAAEEAEKAAAEAAAEAANNLGMPESNGESLGSGGMSPVDMDLGNSADAGEMAEESFSNNSGKEVLLEDNEFLFESDDDLPTPEELNSKNRFYTK